MCALLDFFVLYMLYFARNITLIVIQICLFVQKFTEVNPWGLFVHTFDCTCSKYNKIGMNMT